MTEGTIVLAGVDTELIDPLSVALGGRFTVIEAGDGAAALRQIRSVHVDALLVGAGVDGGGPLPFVADARTLAGPDLPVLVLTGDPSLAASAVEAGATDYVDRDAALEHPDLLVARVESLLDRTGGAESVPATLYAAVRDLPSVGRERDAVELGLRVDTDESVLVRAAARAGCRLVLEGITPRPGGSGLLRVSVDGADIGTVSRAVTSTRGVDELEPAEEDEEALTLLVSEVGLLSHLADHGATVRSLAVDPEGADVTVGLPGSIDVRSFVETCSVRFPGTELVARRECEPPDPGDRDRTWLLDDLTDRQCEAVLAAHRAGYFEWPRESTGEEVAERLDVSGPTFHQHLRKGLAGLLDAVTGDLQERRVER